MHSYLFVGITPHGNEEGPHYIVWGEDLPAAILRFGRQRYDVGWTFTPERGRVTYRLQDGRLRSWGVRSACPRCHAAEHQEASCPFRLPDYSREEL